MNLTIKGQSLTQELPKNGKVTISIALYEFITE